MSTLVVVDMQEHYDPPKRTVKRVVAEVKRHMKLGSEIVLLEDSYYEPTVEPIKRALAGYDNVRVAARDEGSGKREIGPLKGDVDVCGIYTGACVRALVDDIKEDADITVLQKACSDCISRSHERQIAAWKEDPGVRVA